jgi:hypothetical protein
MGKITTALYEPDIILEHTVLQLCSYMTNHVRLIGMCRSLNLQD